MSAYYNEFDPFAAKWLRELIKDGLIADGVVDERSIADVQPEDLKGFTQCHFFAGIGGWSLAARLAGWGDDRPMWTGSPPCQPFSTAGNRKGQDDERHLWPVFFNLIRECRPSVVFGEQVAAAIRTGWFDDLQTDMEAEGYATAMVVLPACSVGAPHKRERLWTVARRLGNAEHNGQHGLQERSSYVQDGQERREEEQELSRQSKGAGRPDQPTDISGRKGGCESGSLQRGLLMHSKEAGRGMADSEGKRNNGGLRPIHFEDERQQACKEQGQDPAQQCGTGSELNSPLADTIDKGSQGRLCGRQDSQREIIGGHAGRGGADSWSGSRLVYCRDGKHRPIPTEPALFPLADGIPNRVGILRGAGNAIVPQVAAEVIGAYMEVRND